MASQRLAWIRFSSLSMQPSTPAPTPTPIPPVPAPRASALARALVRPTVPIKPPLPPTQTQEPTISQSPPPLPPTIPSSPPPPNIAPPRSPVASTTPSTMAPSASPIAALEPTLVAAPLRSSPSPPRPLSTPTNVSFPIGKTNVKSSKTRSVDEVEQKNILAVGKSMKTHITGEYKGAVMELNKNNNSNKSIKFLNSNVQGVNNSILYNAICGHNDPGIHLSNNHE